jgi:hypothetical protein
MQNSMYALSLLCSVATQMKLVEETKRLPGLAELHHENYETSYHRVTAIGCLHRVIAGDRHHPVIGIMIRCMIASWQHDEKADAAIRRMEQAAGGTAARWVQSVRHWHHLASDELQKAMRLVRRLAGESMWQYAQGLEY